MTDDIDQSRGTDDLDSILAELDEADEAPLPDFDSWQADRAQKAKDEKAAFDRDLKAALDARNGVEPGAELTPAEVQAQLFAANADEFLAMLHEQAAERETVAAAARAEQDRLARGESPVPEVPFDPNSLPRDVFLSLTRAAMRGGGVDITDLPASMSEADFRALVASRVGAS